MKKGKDEIMDIQLDHKRRQMCITHMAMERLFELIQKNVYRDDSRRYWIASQEEMVQKLQKEFGVCISRRTLNRWLKKLEKDRRIARVKRREDREKRKNIFAPTAYYILSAHSIIL